MTVQSFSADIVIPCYESSSALATLAPEIKGWVDEYPGVRVFIVDDGSPENKLALPATIRNHDRVTLLRHPENRGRASARNTGLRAGESDFVVFLDVDCCPQRGWLDRFIRGVESGADCVFGNLKADGTSYWPRYLNELYEERAIRYVRGGRDFVTAFCMFRRDHLIEIGGFHEEYTRYGFEDRDLIQSLISSVHFSPLFLEDVYASHSPPSSLASVIRKAVDSGGFSSQIFARRFPGCYRDMSYWFFDARQHSFLYSVPQLIAWKILDKDLLGIKTMMERELLPYPVWKWCTKLASGLAFFYGTYSSKQ